MQHLLGDKVLSGLSPASAHLLTGRTFFPHLISGPFQSGLHIAFGFAIGACLVAAIASWSRGSRYIDAGEARPRPHRQQLKRRGNRNYTDAILRRCRISR